MAKFNQILIRKTCEKYFKAVLKQRNSKKNIPTCMKKLETAHTVFDLELPS